MVHTELHESFLSGWEAGTELGRDAQLWAGSAWQLTGQEAVAQCDAGMVPTEHEQTLLFFLLWG